MSAGWPKGPVQRFLHRAGPFVVFLVFSGAAFLVYREVRQYSLAQIEDALLQIPAGQIVLSLVLTVLSYVVLVGYDLLAVKSVGHPLPLRRVAFASFTGFATSYSFGALLGGGSVRFRLYSAWGLSAAEIVQLVVILGITFWFGVFALAGVVFLVQPFEIDPAWKLPFETTRPLAWPLILMAAGYLAVTVVWRKPIHFRGKAVKLPGFGMSTAQLAVAAADLVLAAGCFYVLLPAGVDVSYARFFGVYLLAVVAVVLTHVPAGAGIFELIILTSCPLDAEKKPLLLAAILVFRVVYYLLPLLVAALLLALHEVHLRARSLRRLVGRSANETADPKL